MDLHGFDGAKRLKTLIGKTPLVGKMPELEAIVLAADTPDRVEAVLQQFRGSRAHKRAMAATLWRTFWVGLFFLILPGRQICVLYILVTVYFSAVYVLMV